MPDVVREKDRQRWTPHPKRNPRQYALTERIKQLCGAGELKNGRGLYRNWQMLVWFGRQSDPANRSGLIPLRDFAATMIALENNGRWQRIVTVGAHVARGHVLVGGGGFDPIDKRVEKADDTAANSWNGWWCTRNGRFHLREDLPDDYVTDALPEGQFKDAAAHPKKRISLFCNDPKDSRTNGRTRARLDTILNEVEQLSSTDLLPHLRAPTFFVAAGAKPLTLRALSATHTREEVKEMDTLTATNVALGSWVIPELQESLTPSIGMQEGELGIVKDVTLERVDIACDGERTIAMENPATEVRKFIKSRTGIDAADLDIVPLVESGQQVSNESCIFGPVRAHSISGKSLRTHRTDSETDKRAKRIADLMGVWSILAEGHKIGRQSTVYSARYVVPTGGQQVFAALIDVDGEDVGSQRITLAGEASLKAPVAAKCRESGTRINLWNVSARVWMKRMLRDRRERENQESAGA